MLQDKYFFVSNHGVVYCVTLTSVIKTLLSTSRRNHMNAVNASILFMTINSNFTVSKYYEFKIKATCNI